MFDVCKKHSFITQVIAPSMLFKMDTKEFNYFDISMNSNKFERSLDYIASSVYEVTKTSQRFVPFGAKPSRQTMHLQ